MVADEHPFLGSSSCLQLLRLRQVNVAGNQRNLEVAKLFFFDFFLDDFSQFGMISFVISFVVIMEDVVNTIDH